MEALKREDFSTWDEYEEYLSYTMVEGSLVKNGDDIGTVLSVEGKVATVRWQFGTHLSCLVMLDILELGGGEEGWEGGFEEEGEEGWDEGEEEEEIEGEDYKNEQREE